MKSNSEMTDVVFEACTLQSMSVKTCFEVLKDVINDVNMHLDSTGIRILTMDTPRCALVHVKMEAENFETFRCAEPMYIGVNVNNLFKLLKTVSNNDVLTLRIRESSTNRLEIEIMNADKNSRTVFRLDLMDIDSQHIEIPDVVCDVVVTIPSSDFQRICRDMSSLSDTMTIESTHDKLVLSCKGEFASQTTELGRTEHGITFEGEEGVTVTGSYAIRYLNLFMKASSLSPRLELYLKNSWALVFLFRCPSFGTVKFALAPKTQGD